MKLTKDMGEGYYLTYRNVSNAIGGYHSVNITINRYDDKWYYCEINDKFGNFNDYPGITPGKWKDKVVGPVYAATRFVLSMTEFVNGECGVMWMLQPDGRYFEDEDGFGGDDREEIKLYSIMDAHGHFLTPFDETEIFSDRKWLMIW